MNNNHARDALAAHQQELRSKREQAEELREKIVAFQQQAAATGHTQALVSTLRAQRAQALEAVAVGEHDEGVLDGIDANLAEAETAARIADRQREIASAGAALLTRQRDALCAEIAQLAASTKAYAYHAAVENAASKLPAYRAALEALATATASLAGACLAADKFIELHEKPVRMPVTGGLRVDTFIPVLPHLPGCADTKEWAFDIGTQAEKAQAAALSELGLQG